MRQPRCGGTTRGGKCSASVEAAWTLSRAPAQPGALRDKVDGVARFGRHSPSRIVSASSAHRRLRQSERSETPNIRATSRALSLPLSCADNLPERPRRKGLSLPGCMPRPFLEEPIEQSKYRRCTGSRVVQPPLR
jgi:hypothetical protein